MTSKEDDAWEIVDAWKVASWKIIVSCILLIVVFITTVHMGLLGEDVRCDVVQPDFNTSENSYCFSGQYWSCNYCERFDDCPMNPYNNPVCVGEGEEDDGITK